MKCDMICKRQGANHAKSSKPALYSHYLAKKLSCTQTVLRKTVLHSNRLAKRCLALELSCKKVSCTQTVLQLNCLALQGKCTEAAKSISQNIFINQFSKVNSPTKCQLNILISNLKQRVDDFVRELISSNHSINALCEMRVAKQATSREGSNIAAGSYLKTQSRNEQVTTRTPKMCCGQNSHFDFDSRWTP